MRSGAVGSSGILQRGAVEGCLEWQKVRSSNIPKRSFRTATARVLPRKTSGSRFGNFDGPSKMHDMTAAASVEVMRKLGTLRARDSSWAPGQCRNVSEGVWEADSHAPERHYPAPTEQVSSMRCIASACGMSMNHGAACATKTRVTEM